MIVGKGGVAVDRLFMSPMPEWVSSLVRGASLYHTPRDARHDICV